LNGKHLLIICAKDVNLLREGCKYYSVWFLKQRYVYHYWYINHCLQVHSLNTTHKYKQDKNFKSHKMFPLLLRLL